MDYVMFKKGIDVREFREKLITKVMYTSKVEADNGIINIKIKKSGMGNGKS